MYILIHENVNDYYIYIMDRVTVCLITLLISVRCYLYLRYILALSVMVRRIATDKWHIGISLYYYVTLYVSSVMNKKTAVNKYGTIA